MRIVHCFYAKEEAAAALVVQRVDDAIRVLLWRLIEDARSGEPEITKQVLEVAVNRVMKMIDRNGDGGLSCEELMDGFKAYHTNINHETIASLIRRFDTDKSGQLDVSEFANGILDFYEEHQNEFAPTDLILCREEEEVTMAQLSWALGPSLNLEAALSWSDRSGPEQFLPTPNLGSCEFPESRTTPLSVSQCVDLSPPPSPIFLDDGEIAAQILAKASYCNRSLTVSCAGNSNCSEHRDDDASDAAYTDSAVTVPMVLADTSVGGTCSPAAQRGARPSFQWTTYELETWPV